MAEENATNQPPACERHSAADIRMLFEVNIADVRECKAQEWYITFLVFLLFGAIVAADRLLPDDLDPFIFATVLVAGGGAIFSICKFRWTIVTRRKRLDGLEVHLCVPADGRPKRTGRHWRDVWLPVFLTIFIALGIFAAAWIVLGPEPPLFQCFTAPQT
jgi:hypothetical protein